METPPGRLLLRGVRILLECILVIVKIMLQTVSQPNVMTHILLILVNTDNSIAFVKQMICCSVEIVKK